MRSNSRKVTLKIYFVHEGQILIRNISLNISSGLYISTCETPGDSDMSIQLCAAIRV